MVLLDFNSWWTTLNTLEQIYWIFAIPSSLAFLIILIMTFAAGDFDDSGAVDSEIDSDHGIGFQFFTLKNLVGFFTVFSWVGLACIDSGLGTSLTIIISVISGTLMMVLMGLLFYFMGKLVDSGTMDIRNAVGQVGEVYLTIGGNESRFGQVQINIQGSMRTLQAMTDEKEDIPVGTIVRVKRIVNDSILMVTKSGN